MELIIDSREKSRIKLAEDYFTNNPELNMDYNVETAQLKAGDYLFNNEVVFEFKTQDDFISSILDGRVFNEAIDQHKEYEHHFVIVQGTNRDRKRALENRIKYQNFTLKQYYGAIARLNTYTTVIQSTGTVEDAFYQMHVQTLKCLDSKDMVKHFDTKSPNNAYNVLCYCLDGVHDVRAKNIVNTLDLHSVFDLLHVTKADLLTVNGIGEVLAENIITQIYGM